MLEDWSIILLGMDRAALGLSNQDSWVNSVRVSPGQGSSASPAIASPKIASRSPGIIKISAPPDEINDLLHVRQDLHFPLTTINKSKFTEIMEPKSYEDLEKYLPWMSLVRDIFQPRPVIVENTKEELKRINLSSGKKDFSSIRQQRYWQNQIFLRWAVEEGLSNGYHKQDLKSWLEDLHKIACSGLDGNNHYYYYPNNGKFSSPGEGVMTRYQKKSPEELRGYFEKFKQFLDLRNSSKNNEDWLVELAEKYGDVTAGPPFERINNSIVMNILNLMLKKHGMKEISHGNLEQSFLLSKWDKEKLQQAIGEFPHSIFLRAILQTNIALKKELGTLLKTPATAAIKHKRYLGKLSELYKSGVLKPETYHLMKYLSVEYLADKGQVFQEIIEFKDLLKKGVQKGVFTDELFTNCLADISKAFDNLNLSEVLSKSRKIFLLDSLGLKSRYQNFDTSVSTLDDLLVNNNRELAVRNIDNYERSTRLHTEGLNFLNNQNAIGLNL